MGFKDTYSLNVCFWFGYMTDVLLFKVVITFSFIVTVQLLLFLVLCKQVI